MTRTIGVRVSANERELLAYAAQQGRAKLSDFIRRSAVAAAEMDIVGHASVIIPAADWERFEAWVSEPAKDAPTLRELAASRTAWKD